MNFFVDPLNHWSDPLAAGARLLFFQSSLLIIVLLVFDGLVRNRVRAAIRYGFWLLLLVKLVVPPGFAFPTGLGYWRPQPAAPLRADSGASMLGLYPAFTGESNPAPGIVRVGNRKPPGLKPSAVLLLVWLGVALGFLAWLIRRSRMVSRMTSGASAASPELNEIFDACRRRARVKGRVELKLSPDTTTPVVCGFWRPVILLPQELVARLTRPQLRAVLLHELGHISRGDIWINHAQTLLQIVYWWHPLLWLANSRIRCVREEAVDEWVMAAMGEEGEGAYPGTLLAVARYASMRPAVSLGLLGIAELRHSLRRRLQHLLNFPAPRETRLGIASWAMILAAGALVLPMAGRARTQEGAGASKPARVNAGTKEAPEVAMGIKVQFIALPIEAIEQLRLGEPQVRGVTNQHIGWIRHTEAAQKLTRDLTASGQGNVLASPRVITVSGRPARISMTRSEIVPPATRPGSLECELVPRWRGGIIDLAVSAKIREQMELTPQSGYSVNAHGYIDRDVANLFLSLKAGESAILQNPSARDGDGKAMLLVVTPTREGDSAPPRNPPPGGASLLHDLPVTAPKDEGAPASPTTAGEALETRNFKLDEFKLLKLDPAGNTEPLTDATRLNALRQIITTAGFRVGGPNEVYFKPTEATLTVRATPRELALVERAIRALGQPPAQIMIEAKFIEVFSQGIQKLGLDGLDQNSRPWTTTLNRARTKAMIHALEQLAGTDILSAPKVTTLSGRPAQIWAGDVKSVVTGIDPRALTAPGVSAVNGETAQPFLVTNVSLGCMLDITPTVGDDGITLQLDTVAQVTEFIGYDAESDRAKRVRVWVEGKARSVTTPVPLLRKRRLPATIQVSDGHTLLLANPVDEQGRPIEKAKDKRLLVLITATLIDPAGNPVNRE